MFVGRSQELSKLRRVLSREPPAITVVYGRRRIGKTELIRTALRDQTAYFFEGLENQPHAEQIQSFLFQLDLQTGIKTEGRRQIRTWREAFIQLRPALTRAPGCVVLDEFQWMANYRTAIVADLKMVWEQYLGRIPGVSLILCGSIASFMITRVVQSSALYGRTDLTIHLRGFQLAESALMLPELGLDELLEAQMLLGGVPKYLELLRGHPSVVRALDELAFSQDGYFVHEYDRIFVSHFGRNPDYARIVDALARHSYGLRRAQLAEVADVEKGGRLSEHLKDLEAAGFISTIRPVGKGPTSRLTKHLLSDAFLRFHAAFIRPRRDAIDAGLPHLFSQTLQTGLYHDWRGRAFEYVCFEHRARIAELLGFAGIEYAVGPYFRSQRRQRPGVQIDLLFDRADRVLTLCEMKCTWSPVESTVEAEVERKVQWLAEAYPRHTIQRVLIVHGDVTRAVARSTYFYRIIHAEEFLARGVGA